MLVMAELLNLSKPNSAKDLDSLIAFLDNVPNKLRAIFLWVAVIGNYPSLDEFYQLDLVLASNKEFTKKFLREKQIAYRKLGLPNTFIRKNPRKLLLDVTETVHSGINSGIQRIVRMSSKVLESDVSFTGWIPKFGILKYLGPEDVYDLQNWQPKKSKKKRLSKKVRDLPTISKQLIKSLTRPYPKLQFLLIFLFGKLKTLNNLLIQSPRWVLINSKDNIELVFDPAGHILVLELQSLDPAIMERTRVQLVSGLFQYSFLVHDILPIRYPEFFSPGTVGNFAVYADNLSLSKTLYVMSKSEYNHLSQFLSINKKFSGKIKLISPPSFKEFTSTSQKPKIERFRARKIIIVGSLEPRKNHIRMLRAVLSSAKYFDGISVTMIYPNKWLSANLELEISEVKNKGIEINMLYSISDSELFKLYSESTLLLYCSLAEGLGLPLLEARSFSLPAITSNTGFMSEIKNYGGVLCVNPYDIGEISLAITSVLTDFNVWSKLSNETNASVGIPWDEYAKQFSGEGY